MSKLYESSILQANMLPEIVDEVTDDLYYLVFLNNGDLTKAQICQIEKVGNITTRKYPGGSKDFIFSYDLRDTYDYQFKK